MCRSLPIARTTTSPSEADPDLHLHAMRAAHLLAVAADRLLHGQGRIAGPHRMVLMGRGAPKRAMMPSPMTWLTVPS